MPRGPQSDVVPEGFLYTPEFLTEMEEASLIEFARSLPYRTFEMRGYTAKRRVVHFGWHYSFDSFRLTEAEPIPPELLPVRARTAAIAGIDPDEFVEALVTEYADGAGIGWHRDAPPFGVVAGISLAASCRMRFQRGKGEAREPTAALLEPRSLYLLTGPARSQWEHSIPRTYSTRYSVTFRTLKRPRALDTSTRLAGTVE